MEYPDNSILLVDDEISVLNALYRLLRPLKCKVFLAESATEGLELLRSNSINMVISDMRMPEMSGEAFLEQVAKEWPATERIVMTGYSDPQATIDAINRGRISRFLLKPWDDAEVIKVVEKGFELAHLKRENEALQLLTEQKNQELKCLNLSLEAKVQARTEQIKQANESLKTSYRSVVRMFSALTARRLGQSAQDSLALNKIFVAMAQGCGLSKIELKQLYYAWQLRNIGKLSFDDELLKPAYVTLLPEQQRQFHKHPLLAQAATLLVKPLYPAGEIIRQHKEYLDGSGYPQGLKGDQISDSAQLLCVVNDFVELINGRYQARAFSTTEALDYLHRYAQERYNPAFVARLQVVVKGLAREGETLHDQSILCCEARSGMQLSRDLVSEQGVLLLSAGLQLDQQAIDRLLEMEHNLGEQFEIYIAQSEDKSEELID